MRINKFLTLSRKLRLDLLFANRKSRSARRRRSLVSPEILESRRLLSAAGWATVNATGAPQYMEGMVLLPDGSVMVQASVIVQGVPNATSNLWYNLKPTATGNTFSGTTIATGNYANGTWSQMPSSGTWMQTLSPTGKAAMRLYNNSAVLPDGRVFTIGGEYTSPDPFSGTAEIYSPATINTPAGWKQTAPMPVQFADYSNNMLNSTAITGASNASPIVIQSAGSVNLFNGEQVQISGVLGNTAANGVWKISNVTATSFTLAQGATTGLVSAGNGTFSNNATQAANFTVPQFGDDPIETLPGGKVLVGSFNSKATYIYDPSTDTWSGPIYKKYDKSDEETWVKLRDGSILTYDIYSSLTFGKFAAERFDPTVNQWVDASATTTVTGQTKPSILSDPSPVSAAFPSTGYLQGAELGPAFLLPNGNAMFFGANGHTAIYDYIAKTWSAGKDLPTLGQTGSITGATPSVTGSVTGTTNGTSIVIASTNTAGLSAGDLVTISGVVGDTAANGSWLVTNVTANSFTITTAGGSAVTGNANYISGGTWFSGIKIQTSSTAGLTLGQQVTIAGMTGNTSAVGSWTIANIKANSFQLLGPKSTSSFTAGGTWTAGQLAMADAPGSMMPNGNILLDVSPVGGRDLGANGDYSFPTPAYIYEYNPTTQTYSNVTPSGGITVNSYHEFMLALPSGQVLMDNAATGGMLIYTPSATPATSLRPTINSIVNNFDGTYTLSGTLLRGISEGASYGDEGTMASNYPIVQFADGNGKVTYSTTSSWDNGTSWQSPSPPPVTTTHFTKAPVDGAYLLTVSANGINSQGMLFVQMGATVNSVTIKIDPIDSTKVDVYQSSTLLGKFARSSFNSIDVEFTDTTVSSSPSLNLDYSGGTFNVPISVHGILANSSLGFSNVGGISYKAADATSGTFTIDGSDQVAVANVNVQTVVTTPPHDLLVTGGETAVFTAAAYSTTGQPPTAKWQYSTNSGNTWIDDTADTVTTQTYSSGTTHTKLTFPVIQNSDVQYRAAFSSDGGAHYTYSKYANLHIATSVTYWVGGGKYGDSDSGDSSLWSEGLNWTNGAPGPNTLAIFSSQIPQFTRWSFDGTHKITFYAPRNYNSTVDGDYSIGGLFLANSYGDTLTVNSSLVLSQSSEWDNGYINFGVQGAYVSNDPTSQLVMNNVNTLLIEGAGTLTNYGTMVQTGSSTVTHVLGIAGGTTLNNGPGGVIDMDVDGGFSGQPGYAAGAFINRGLLEKTGGTTTTGSTISTYFTNYGTLDATQGQMVIAPAGVATGGANYIGGTYLADAGASIDPTGNTGVTMSGTLTGGGPGQFAFSHGSLSPAAAGTTLFFPDQFFQWTGGILGGDFTNTGYMTLAGGGQKLLTGTLHNKNTITETTDSLQIAGGALLDNTSVAIYNLASDGGISGQAGYAAGSFLNRGFLVKSVGTSSTSSLISSYFTTIVGFGGQGSIHVQHGVLVINPAGVSSDLNGVAEPANYIGVAAGNSNEIFNVDAGATIDPTGGGTLTSKGILNGIGSGQVAFSQGTMNTITAGATFHFPSGMLQWTGGTLAGTWTNADFVTLAGSGQKLLTGTLHNTNTITETTDSIQIAGGALLDNTITGIYNLASDGGISGQVGYAAGSFLNLGFLVKSVGTSSTGSSITSYFTTIVGSGGQGSIHVQHGVLVINPAGASSDLHGVSEPANYIGVAAGNSNEIFNVDAGATIDPTGGGTLNSRGILNGIGSGQVAFSQGTMNAISGITTFHFPSGMLQWTGGTVSGTWTNAGFVTLAGSGQKLLGGTLLNTATMTQTTDSGIQIAGGASLYNASTGFYKLASDGGIAGQNGYAAGAFFNYGTLQKIGGTLTTGSTVTSYFTNAGKIELALGKLTVASAGSADGVANFHGGTLSLNASAVFDPTGGTSSTFAGTFTGTGGRVIFSQGVLQSVGAGATLYFPSGVFQWTGGNLAGTWANASGSFMSLGGAGQKLVSGTLNNNGLITETTDSIQIAGGGVVDNKAVGTYKLMSDGGIAGQTGYAAGSFFNHGSLQKTAGSTSVGSTVSTYFTTSGTLNLAVGKLTINTPGSADGVANFNGGSVIMSASAILDPTGGGTSSVAGTFTGSGGHVAFSSGTLAPVSAGATLKFPTGVFQWTGGNLPGNWTNAQVMTLSGAGQKLLNGTLHNLNTATVTQTTDGLQIAGGGVFDNQVGATYTLASDGAISGQAGYAAGAFFNHGTLQKTVGILSKSSAVTSYFTTDGTLNVTVGKLIIAPAGAADGVQNYLNGNILVSAGAILDPTGGTTTTASGIFKGSGAGHVIFSQGTLQAGAGATFNFPTGFFQWTAGGMTGTWANAGYLTVAGTTQKLLQGTLNNQSVITETTDSLQIAGGAVLNNQLGATFNLTSDKGISGQAGYGAGAFNNAGTLLKSGGAAISSNTPSEVSVNFTNLTSGQILVQKGSLQIDADVSNTSTLTVSPASRLVVNGNFTQSAAGTVDLQLGGIPTSGLFGSLVVSPGHTATLGGTLKADLVNSFVPGAGNVFTVMTYDTNAATTFAHLTVPASLPAFVGPQSVTLGKNAAPVGASKTVTMLEDAVYTFKTGDFGFSDPNNNPANTLLAVKLKTLPGAGALTDNGATLTAGQFVPASDITAGNLKFAPLPNANGSAYANFTFQVQDNGGTALGGVDTDPTARTMTVAVTSVNDAPVGTSGTVTAGKNTTAQPNAYTLKVTDFGFTDPNDNPKNTLQAVKFTLLPSAATGTLKDNGSPVTLNQFVTATEITGGKLVFTPATNLLGTGFLLCKFQVQDNGGTASGGVNLDPTQQLLRVNIVKVNDAPVGTSTAVSFARNTVYTLKTTDFGFTDPNDSPANSLLSVLITATPTAGTLTDNGIAVTLGQHVSAADIAGGKLKFTPVANASGSPYSSFTFKVQDNGGTANGGIDTDKADRTLTFNVT